MEKGLRFVFTVITAAALISMAAVVSAGAAKNDPVATVYAVGHSRIQGADISASQNAAIADSLARAVTTVLTGLIPLQTAVGNFQVLSETVLANTDRFVADYKMLTESIHGKEHRVMVKVNVSVQRLTLALNNVGIPLSEKQYPRILYCIAERWAGDDDYRYWWGDQPLGPLGSATDAMAGVFKARGFPVAAPAGRPAAALPAELSPAQAVMLGRQLKADVVVVGQAVAEEATSTMGATLRSFSGSISVGAYSVGSGQEIGQARRVYVATADDPAYGSREALNKAALMAGEELAKQVSLAWFAQGAGSSEVEVHVEGISGNVANFVRFRGALSTMSGVDSIQRREMQQDTAVLIVVYQGNVKALADAMLRQEFDTFGLNIYEAQGDRIRLQLVPHKAQQ